MSTFELMDEGVSSPAAERAFVGYNKLLHHDPDQIVAAISQMTLGLTVEKHHEDAANMINEVLDTTNNGTQIGLGPNTEAAWAIVFDDEQHNESQHDYVGYRFMVEELRRTVERLQKDIEIAAARNDRATVAELTIHLNKQAEVLADAEAELIERCRKRGMHTLRVIAAHAVPMNIIPSQTLAA